MKAYVFGITRKKDIGVISSFSEVYNYYIEIFQVNFIVFVYVRIRVPSWVPWKVELAIKTSRKFVEGIYWTIDYRVTK